MDHPFPRLGFGGVPFRPVAERSEPADLVFWLVASVGLFGIFCPEFVHRGLYVGFDLCSGGLLLLSGEGVFLD
jgi:hypothetical protein